VGKAGSIVPRAAAILAVCATPTLALAAQSPPSLADIQQQLSTLQETLATQQRLLQQQQEEIERLRQQLATSSSATPSQAVEDLQRQANAAKLAEQEAPRTTMVGPRPVITSADGRNSLAPRAVVQMDAATHQQDQERATGDFRRGSVGGAGNRETNAARDLSDGVYFRRARMGFEGTIARDWNYRFLGEFGGSGVEGPVRINDAYVAYTGFAPFTIQIGAFSPPANMDDGTGVESSVMIERASPSEMSRTLGGADGRIGIGVRGAGARWMSALTLTSRTANDAEVFDSQLAVVGRAGLLAFTKADYNVHFGASTTWVLDPPDGGTAAAGARHTIRFRDRPEIRVDSTRLIDTGAIDAKSAYASAVEFGANWKSFYIQAENYWYGIERPDSSPLPDPSFGGYYVQGSWFLTGESRRYDVASGAFQAPRPFIPFTAYGGVGAWELALRYSHADLDSRAGTDGTAALAPSVRGGEQNIWTFGVNWFVNPNVRFTLNWLHVDVDRLNPAGVGNTAPFGAAPLTPPVGVQIGQGLDIYALRSQFSF
jgi:phosphate-selective porin OprO/OprP